ADDPCATGEAARRALTRAADVALEVYRGVRAGNDNDVVDRDVVAAIGALACEAIGLTAEAAFNVRDVSLLDIDVDDDVRAFENTGDAVHCCTEVERITRLIATDDREIQVAIKQPAVRRGRIRKAHRAAQRHCRGNDKSRDLQMNAL